MADHLCPSCGICLSGGHLGTAPLDFCIICGGVWLDVLALRELLHSSPGMVRGLYRKVRANSAPIGSRGVPGGCPSCGVSMGEVSLPDVLNAPIFTCAHCRGFWLSGASLERLVAPSDDLELPTGQLTGIAEPHHCPDCGEQNPDSAAY